MGIDLGLIKEVRETTDWLLSFPEKLAAAVLKPQEEYLGRRDASGGSKKLWSLERSPKRFSDSTSRKAVSSYGLNRFNRSAMSRMRNT